MMHERGSVKKKTNSVMYLNGGLSNYKPNVVLSYFKTCLRIRLEGTGFNGWKFHIRMTMKIGFLEIRKIGEDIDTERDIAEEQEKNFFFKVKKPL